MSSETDANFDPMRALRILLKLEETPDADMSYLRKLLLADVRRHLDVVMAEAAPEASPADA